MMMASEECPVFLTHGIYFISWEIVCVAPYHRLRKLCKLLWF